VHLGGGGPGSPQRRDVGESGGRSGGVRAGDRESEREGLLGGPRP
jgi:hypothetical protein